MIAIELLELLQEAIEEGIIDEEAEVTVTYQPRYPLVANFDGLHVGAKGNLQIVAGEDIGYGDGEAYEEDGLIEI